ncbi:MAG: lipopolysaccharide biosynthesis protein, partial [Gemmatimonadetes bacterium]|nr:lipopolysaccharide biosynthesis protein [Gemmatimonadota bacterium]
RIALAQQIYATVAQRYELANIEAVRNTPVITVLDAPEGLVEARPRYTRQIVLAVLVVGVIIAAAIALWSERSAPARNGT